MNSTSKAGGGAQLISPAAAQWVAGTEQRVNDLLLDSVSDGEVDTSESLRLLDAQGQASLASTTVSKFLSAQGKVLDGIVQNLRG